jgi:hypothetical protein
VLPGISSPKVFKYHIFINTETDLFEDILEEDRNFENEIEMKRVQEDFGILEECYNQIVNVSYQSNVSKFIKTVEIGNYLHIVHHFDYYLNRSFSDLENIRIPTTLEVGWFNTMEKTINTELAIGYKNRRRKAYRDDARRLFSNVVKPMGGACEIDPKV